MLMGVLDSFEGLVAIQIALQKQVDLLRHDMDQARTFGRIAHVFQDGEKLG